MARTKKKSEKSEESEKSEINPSATPEQVIAENGPMTEPEVSLEPEVTPEPETQPEPTALVPVENPLDAQRALAERLPARYKEDVLFLVRPTSAQLLEIVDNLPEASRAKMLDVVRKTRPKKQGAHTAKEGFTPILIKLYHGTGNDPVRPRNTLPGQFYSADSRVLGEKFDGSVIHFYEGRILWPPRAEGGGSGEGGKAPLCSSVDRLTGSRYGSCAACPNANKAYNQGGCAKEVVTYLVDRDTTGIYEMRFSKSSQGSGEALVKILDRSDNVWDRWFTFEAVARDKGDNRWYVAKANAVVGADGITSSELHPLFESLSMVIDADVYYPALANVYDRASGSTDGDETAGEQLDESALLGGTGDPDYSGGDNLDV